MNRIGFWSIVSYNPPPPAQQNSIGNDEDPYIRVRDVETSSLQSRLTKRAAHKPNRSQLLPATATTSTLQGKSKRHLQHHNLLE